MKASSFWKLARFLVKWSPVHGHFGFTNRCSDWLTCFWLWRAKPIVTYPNKHGEISRRCQRDERRQYDVIKRQFLFRGLLHCGYFEKAGIPCLFQRLRTILCSPTWDVKQSTGLPSSTPARLRPAPVCKKRPRSLSNTLSTTDVPFYHDEAMRSLGIGKTWSIPTVTALVLNVPRSS